MLAAKDLMQSMGVHNLECRVDGTSYDVSERAGYIFNSGISAIEGRCHFADRYRRAMASLINARIRKAKLNNPDLSIALIGEAVDLTYDYHHAGTDLGALNAVVQEAISRHEFRPKANDDCWRITRSLQVKMVRRFKDWCVKPQLPWAASRMSGSALMFCTVRQAAFGAIEIEFLPSQSFDVSSMEVVPSSGCRQ